MRNKRDRDDEREILARAGRVVGSQMEPGRSAGRMAGLEVVMWVC